MGISFKKCKIDINIRVILGKLNSDINGIKNNSVKAIIFSSEKDTKYFIKNV